MKLEDIMIPNPDFAFVEHTVREARARMDAAGASHLFVVDGDRVIGTVSRADIDSLAAEAGDRQSFVEAVDPEILHAKRACAPADLLAEMKRSGKEAAAVVDDNLSVIGYVERGRLEQAGVRASARDDPARCLSPSALEVAPTVERGGRASMLRVYSETPQAQAAEDEADSIEEGVQTGRDRKRR